MQKCATLLFCENVLVLDMSLFKSFIGGNVKCKHIYICYVDRYIGAYNPHTGEVVGYKTSDKFVPFVQEILENFPDYSPHNVINDGIRDIIREKIKQDLQNGLLKNELCGGKSE